MRTMKWCLTPRAVGGWIVGAVVMVTGLGMMAAWVTLGSPHAMGSTSGDSGQAQTGAPKASSGAVDPMRGEPASAQPGSDSATQTNEQATQEEPVIETATFAAGCFWGVQVAFDRVPGVVRTSVGFMGGTAPNVTYEQVCRHDTGYAEVVHVEFDPAKVTYEDLLNAFWHAHDPTTLNRQGPDVGDQYRSAIFYASDAQKAAAEKSKAAMQASAEFREAFGDRTIVTEIAAAGAYYPAEEYHQKYFEHRGMAASCHRGW